MSDTDRCFIGVMDCGCRVAVIVDGRDAFTRRAVNDMLKRGYGIETTTVAGHRANPIKNCTHKTADPDVAKQDGAK